MLQLRLCVSVPECIARSMKPRERLLTEAYRKKNALLCSRVPFRIACNVFNDFTQRQLNGQPIPLQTFVNDFYSEGSLVYAAKRALTLQILKEYHFDSETLTYVGDSWPEEWKQPDDLMITITGNDPLPEWIPEWDIYKQGAIAFDVYDFEEGADGEIESVADYYEEAKQLYSKPDTEPIILKKKRRSTRYEVEEDIQWVCDGYVDWFNREVKEDNCKILQSWVMEKGSAQVAYISIDAVYVDKQCSTHVSGIKPEMKENKERIPHWNAALEFDGIRYCLTDKKLFGVFQQLFAFLLINNLMNRYLVFFADGEIDIFDSVKAYFSNWLKSLLLDWYHVQEKIHQRMSSAIVHKMVVDPRKKAKAESEGTSKKDPKKTALSNLYARKLYSILWVGNVDAAIDYLKHIDPNDIKNQDAIDKLIAYLDNKREWIVCYALRKRAGLRNSSNGSEGVNHVLVARRQKIDGMTWSDDGSYSGSNLMVLYANEEDNLWFKERRVTFTVGEERRSKGRDSIRRQVHGKCPQ